MVEDQHNKQTIFHFVVLVAWHLNFLCSITKFIGISWYSGQQIQQGRHEDDELMMKSW